jgi:hypothetical protein
MRSIHAAPEGPYILLRRNGLGHADRCILDPSPRSGGKNGRFIVKGTGEPADRRRSVEPRPEMHDWRPPVGGAAWQWIRRVRGVGLYRLGLVASFFPAWRTIQSPSTFNFFLLEALAGATVGIFVYHRMREAGPTPSRSVTEGTSTDPGGLVVRMTAGTSEVTPGPSDAAWNNSKSATRDVPHSEVRASVTLRAT